MTHIISLVNTWSHHQIQRCIARGWNFRADFTGNPIDTVALKNFWIFKMLQNVHIFINPLKKENSKLWSQIWNFFSQNLTWTNFARLRSASVMTPTRLSPKAGAIRLATWIFSLYSGRSDKRMAKVAPPCEWPMKNDFDWFVFSSTKSITAGWS